MNASSEQDFGLILNTGIQVFESVLSPGSAIYAAGPLETGLIYYEAAARGRVDRAEIRKVNQANLSEFVAELRAASDAAVIDPGILQIEGWPNELYGRFFIAVIERFAREARFLDGWQFSRGATSELIFCLENDIPCRSRGGKEISPEIATESIEAAVQHLDALGQDSSRFQARLSSLHSLAR